MLIEWLYELKESVDKHGIRLGVILTIFVVYRKELRNLRLDKRDEAIFNNQRIIMEKLGVVDQWHGPVKMSDAEVMNLKRWQLLYWEAISRVGNLLRRGRKMNQQINWYTLVPSVFSAIKLILQPFGIDLSGITDENLNSVVNGVAALFVIIGVFANHFKRKGVTPIEPYVYGESNK